MKSLILISTEKVFEVVGSKKQIERKLKNKKLNCNVKVLEVENGQ